MFNDVQSAMNYVMARKKANFTHGFDDFKRFMAQQGNPQNALKIIHIAGTNGKGSTTNYLRSILQTAGYRVGSFTSPHLITHLDRIRINDENIDADYFLMMVNRYQDLFEKEGMSMFEIDTFIALNYFKEQKVDYVVFEVGLGGRLDSTNVVNPLISVITNIEMDHMAILGNSIAQIAYEKAGIIKPNTPIVTFERKDEALSVFCHKCAETNSELICTKEAEHIQLNNHIEYDYDGLRVVLPTQALYQVYNSSLAIEVIHQLNRHGTFSIDDEIILKGLNTIWKGRFEKISDNPEIIVDGGHNNNGIDELCRTLKALGGNYIIVFSALKDKTFHEMLLKLMQCGEVIVTCFENDRSTTAKDLASGTNARVIDNYDEAIAYAVSTGKTTIVTGSLYFVSVVREKLCYNKTR